MDDKKQKDYKRPTLLAVLVTAAALLVTLLSLSLKGGAAVPVQGKPTGHDTVYYTPKPAASQESAAASASREEGPYRVTLYQGKIGVFLEGETEPCLVSDVDVFLLPQEDVALLKEGLSAQTLTEVRAILEDYE